MKICLVSSVGGHLSELLQLRGIYGRHEHFYILNDTKLLPAFMQGRTHFITHSERDWKTLKNLWECYVILRRERPDVLLSCGAGPAIPAFAVARWLGIRSLYLESFCAIERPTLTGQLMQRLNLATELWYQWPQLSPFFPKRQQGGLVFDRGIAPLIDSQRAPPRVLVTVGNARESFERMLIITQAALAALGITDITWQTGHSKSQPQAGRVTPFLTPEAFAHEIREASVVITHAGEGAVMEAVQQGHVPIVVARRHALGEHINDHQLELATALSRLGWIRVASNEAELRNALAAALAGNLPAVKLAPATVHAKLEMLLESYR